MEKSGRLDESRGLVVLDSLLARDQHHQVEEGHAGWPDEHKDGSEGSHLRMAWRVAFERDVVSEEGARGSLALIAQAAG